jgi:hypothetical protein
MSCITSKFKYFDCQCGGEVAVGVRCFIIHPFRFNGCLFVVSREVQEAVVSREASLYT